MYFFFFCDLFLPTVSLDMSHDADASVAVGVLSEYCPGSGAEPGVSVVIFF
jgi:hypothetical protein